MDGIKLSLKPIFDFYISRSEPKFFKERQQIVIKTKYGLIIHHPKDDFYDYFEGSTNTLAYKDGDRVALAEEDFENDLFIFKYSKPKFDGKGEIKFSRTEMNLATGSNRRNIK